MDPSKKIGKIKEQIERENNARRKYPKKWGELADPELNKFYNQNAINMQLKKDLEFEDLCPYRYTNEGESHFVSKGMYESLVGQCRCGRPRNGAHIIRCLQKERDRFAASADSNRTTALEKPNIPETSNASFGFVPKKPVYQQWEQSMKYISPVYTMPGFRMTARPYNAIIIG